MKQVVRISIQYSFLFTLIFGVCFMISFWNINVITGWVNQHVFASILSALIAVALIYVTVFPFVYLQQHLISHWPKYERFWGKLLMFVLSVLWFHFIFSNIWYYDYLYEPLWPVYYVILLVVCIVANGLFGLVVEEDGEMVESEEE